MSLKLAAGGGADERRRSMSNTPSDSGTAHVSAAKALLIAALVH